MLTSIKVDSLNMSAHVFPINLQISINKAIVNSTDIRIMVNGFHHLNPKCMQYVPPAFEYTCRLFIPLNIRLFLGFHLFGSMQPR